MPEAAQIISDAAGKTIEFIQTPIEELRKFSEDFAIMLEWFDSVGYNADIKSTAQETSVKPITFAEWAKQIDWS